MYFKAESYDESFIKYSVYSVCTYRVYETRNLLKYN